MKSQSLASPVLKDLLQKTRGRGKKCSEMSLIFETIKTEEFSKEDIWKTHDTFNVVSTGRLLIMKG